MPPMVAPGGTSQGQGTGSGAQPAGLPRVDGPVEEGYPGKAGSRSPSVSLYQLFPSLLKMASEV